MKFLWQIIEHPINLLWWLHLPLFWWVRVKLFPKSAKDLQINGNAAVLYVLPMRSLTDFLILYRCCKDMGLPLPMYRPKTLKSGGKAALVYLSKLGLLQPKKTEGPHSAIQNICQRVKAEPSLDVQVVPVSIIWGRSPASEERSLFKLLFPDDEHAGLLQKLFIVLAQGRDTIVNFGKPISLREQVDIDPTPEQTARKVRRVIRVHFRSQRIMTQGPKHYDRARIIGELVRSKPVQEAIAAEVQKKGSTVRRVEQKARQYFNEIASSQTYSVIRFFDVLLTFIWNKIYDGTVVRGGERLRDLAEKYEIVYVPSHRSHLDYLVMPYQLYYLGLITPHVAAGVNLSFWPLGPLLRRGGAFFIRRTFKGNRLYTVAFEEYLSFLINKGHAICFFPEGGRSRTGRLLNPKTGMLSMVVASYMQKPEKPLVFIPVYIGYDKVGEVRSYFAELRGSKKKQESFTQLLQARNVLRSKHGKAYLGFGDPVFLHEYLDKNHPGWQVPQPPGEGETPKWMHKCINDLSIELMRRINRAALISPVALASLAILSTPQHALAAEEFVAFLEKLIAIFRNSRFASEVSIAVSDPKEILAICEQVAPIQRFSYPGGGDVIYLNENDGINLSYYRNNILHLYAIPALIASFLQHNDEIAVEDLVVGCLEIYPFLQIELFLPWNDDELRDEINRAITSLKEIGFVVATPDGKRVQRPTVNSDAFMMLKSLSRILGYVLERYGISAAMLSGLKDKGMVKREEFEAQCHLLAQRISILNGIQDPEFFDKTLFRNYVEMLKKLGFVHDSGDGLLTIDDKVMVMAERTGALLSRDVAQSIQRITAGE